MSRARTSGDDMVQKNQFLEELFSSDEFAIESAKLEFALELKRMLDREGISNAEFAERLQVSRPMVSKLLRGDANLTIETMVKACRQVAGKLFISIVREGCSARLFEIAQAEKHRGHAPKAKHFIPVSGGLEDAWSFAANDLNTAEERYEAEPLAA